MQFVTLMKAIATLLVMNSHCDEIMPIPALATGGSIGDTFFFAVSGFTLYKSVNASFGKYAKRRIERLYPSIIIATTLILVLDSAYAVQHGMCDFRHFSATRFLATFIYPTCFPFLAALIAYYILYYIILHLRKTSKIKAIATALLVVITLYAIYYIVFLDKTKWSIESFPIKYLYWFVPFLVGGGIRAYYEPFSKWCENKAKLFMPLSLILFFVFYSIKVFLQRYELMYLQFVIHIVEIAFLVAFFAWMVSIEETLSKFSRRRCWKAVDYLGGITLQNYLLMDFVIWIFYNLSLRFPYSYICVFVMTLICSGILKFLVEKVSNITLNKGMQ